jgi:uncharacterized protein DUF6920
MQGRSKTPPVALKRNASYVSFNEGGEVIGIFAPARFRKVNGKYEPFPWAGRFWSYEERGRMMIPIEGEVEWHLSEGNAPYWRGRIVDVDYDFAR